MFSSEKEFLEHWSIFLDNLDTIGHPVIDIEISDDRKYNDFLFGKDCNYKYRINKINVLDDSPDGVEFVITENAVRIKILPIDSEFPVNIEAILFGDALEDQLKLAEYIGVLIPVFKEVFSRIQEQIEMTLDNLNQKGKRYSDFFNINTVYISKLDKVPVFMSFDDYQKNISELKKLLTESTLKIYTDKYQIMLFGFLNEDLETDLYFHSNGKKVLFSEEDYSSLVKFPMTLDSCSNSKNKNKLDNKLSYIRRVLDRQISKSIKTR